MIERTLAALLALDYPRNEIVVVDDGSTDRTPEILAPYAAAGDIRLRRQARQRGQGDGAQRRDPGHARRDRLHRRRRHPAAAGHAAPPRRPLPPRPRRRRGRQPAGHQHRLAARQGPGDRVRLDRLRAAPRQRVWGRILTVSGAICAFRKSAMVDVGLFDPEMATEDIALTWKLQRRFYDVRYEPRAVVAMQVPETVKGLYHQRKRWATASRRCCAATRRCSATGAPAGCGPSSSRPSSRSPGPTPRAMIGFWSLSYAVGLDPLGANPRAELLGDGHRHGRARAARRRHLARPPLQPRASAASTCGRRCTRSSTGC